MRLRQSRLAQADLAAIAQNGVEKFGADQTLQYLDLFDARFRRLLEFPEIGRQEPDLHPQIRSLSCHAHRIYYSIETDTVVIRRILHKAMDVHAWLV